MLADSRQPSHAWLDRSAARPICNSACHVVYVRCSGSLCVKGTLKLVASLFAIVNETKGRAFILFFWLTSYSRTTEIADGAGRQQVQ